jgi:precorrin-8X/cobalt-precorrin-8 methylmutase
VRLALAEAGPGAVVVIGCAPTAAFAVAETAGEPDTRPALVVALPVGFVDAAEAKAAVREAGLPALTNRGPKGGSAVAAAAVNALARLAADTGEGPR